MTKREQYEKAWYDYCITNRLIAYGEVPELTEEQVEAFCKERLEKDWKEIKRSRYDSRVYCKWTV